MGLTNHLSCVILYPMKEKKTFKFTVAPNKANRMAGWTSTIDAYGMLWALTKLKERGVEVKKIEEIER